MKALVTAHVNLSANALQMLTVVATAGKNNLKLRLSELWRKRNR